MELLLLFGPVVPKESCRNFHLCWNCGRKYLQIQCVWKGCYLSLSFVRHQIYKKQWSLYCRYLVTKSYTLEQSFNCCHHRKNQVGWEQTPHQRHLLFPQNRTPLWYFQELHPQVLFYLQIFHLKYPQPLVQIYLLNHPLVQALEDHHAVHRFYHQVLFVPYLFISSYSLVNVCVWEPYKLFSGVKFDDGPKRL